MSFALRFLFAATLGSTLMVSLIVALTSLPAGAPPF